MDVPCSFPSTTSPQVEERDELPAQGEAGVCAQRFAEGVGLKEAGRRELWWPPRSPGPRRALTRSRPRWALPTRGLRGAVAQEKGKAGGKALAGSVRGSENPSEPVRERTVSGSGPETPLHLSHTSPWQFRSLLPATPGDELAKRGAFKSWLPKPVRARRTYGEREAFSRKLLPQIRYELLSYVFFLRKTETATIEPRSTAHPRTAGRAAAPSPPPARRCPRDSPDPARKTRCVPLGCSSSRRGRR